MTEIKNISDLLDQDDYTLLDCRSIEPNPDQDRQDWQSDYACEQYESLKKSIEKDGKVKRAIEVVKKDNGRYMIIAGERRWRISVNLKFPKIPAVIRKDITPEQASIDMLTENENHSPLSPIERALAYQKRIENFGFSVNELSEKTGIPKRRIYESMALMKLDEELIEVVKKTFTRDIKMVLDLGKLKDRNPGSYQQGLSLLAKNKLTRKKLGLLMADKLINKTEDRAGNSADSVHKTYTIQAPVAHSLYVKARRLRSYDVDPTTEEFCLAFNAYINKLTH
jgi:ParB/RepB/Spo0J family partition protein